MLRARSLILTALSLAVALAAGASHTLAAAPDPVIAAAGDIACSPLSSSFNGGLGTPTRCHQRHTSDLLMNVSDLAAVLVLGDSQYNNGTLDEYAGSYDPSWGRLKAITHPAPGNHEYQTPEAAGYYAYFGAAAGSPPVGRGYYSFDVGAWHILSLNSNCGAERLAGCLPVSPQVAWIVQDLDANAAKCTLAYFHHPRFASGSNHGNDENMATIWALLHARGVDVVLAGHEHNYERIGPLDATGNPSPDGMRSFVVGTGGNSHYAFGAPIPGSEVRDSTAFGVLTMTLHADSYDWEFVNDGSSGFTDSGSADCR